MQPDWQGRGVGRALLERLTSGLRALGYHSAILWTLRDRRATRRFYEANGWEFDGAEDSLDLQGPRATWSAMHATWANRRDPPADLVGPPRHP